MSFSSVTQLGLGTVQLGLPYGNMTGAPLMPKEQSFSILDQAVKGGLRFFDTAIAYGESEARIGAFNLAEKCADATIATKIPPISTDISGDENLYWKWLLEQIDISRRRLNISKHGLLQFHQCDLDFLTSTAVKNNLKRLLAEGYCQRVGISVYTPDQAYAAAEIPAVSALQVPVNLIDWRFLEPVFQQAMRNRGISLIGRSIFLQGVLIEDAALPPVKRAEDLKKLRFLAARALHPIGLQNAAFRLVRCNFKGNIPILLIGVDSPSSLMQNLTLFQKSVEPIHDRALEALDEARSFAQDRNLLNPGHWND